MSTQINIDETLAVIASDIKKLVKHFKLDRRKQNDDGADNKPMPEPDNAILENINTGIIELSTRKFFTKEQIEQLKVIATAVSDYFEQRQNREQAELKSLLEIITGKLEEHQAAPQKTTARHEHYFTVDFRNSKAALTMTLMALVIVILSGFNIHQANRNSDLRDNDIKYRYVKMQGKASAADIYRLESIFEYDLNADSMKTIRRQIEDFERLLKEYNEKQYRIRQDETRAREIEQKAATVRGRNTQK